jgi:hypothetical protein
MSLAPDQGLAAATGRGQEAEGIKEDRQWRRRGLCGTVLRLTLIASLGAECALAHARIANFSGSEQ